VTIAVDDSYIVNKNAKLNGNLLSNDYDPEGNQQTVSTTPVSAPLHGKLVLNANGTFSYTPDQNFTGTDQFIYQVCDNGVPQACDKATVYVVIVPVNHPPVATDDINHTFKGKPVTGNVLTNDSDPDNDPLIVNPIPVVAPKNGTLILNPDGTYTYTPNQGFTGTDKFTYQVCDNQTPALCKQADVNITVMDVATVNNPPTANVDTYYGKQGLPINGIVITNDWDIDGNLNTTSVALVGTTPDNGQLTLNPDGTFTFVPATGFSGKVSFTYKICDTGLPALCDEAVVIINILPINAGNKTFAVDDVYIGNEITKLTGNVLSNDYDPEGNLQTVNTTPVTNPLHGILSLNENGTFSYTPDAMYTGTDQFIYQICDNGTPQACDKATVYLTILPINHPPVAINDLNSTNKDKPVSGNVLTNDSDPDGDLLKVNTTPIISPKNGNLKLNPDGTYTYTPNAGFAGTEKFTYQVCDNQTPALCAQAEVTITVINPSAINNPPVANEDSYYGKADSPVKGNVLTNDWDPEGNLNPTSVALVGTAPANGTLTLNPDGTFTFVPSAGFTGKVSFTYKVCDTGVPSLCDDAIVTIDILSKNSANTTFAIDDSYIGNQNTTLTGNLLLNDYDLEGNLQTISTTPVSVPLHGKLVLNANGTFSYTPDPLYSGTDQFIYQVCDNGVPQACDKATVYLIIKYVNVPPIATYDVILMNQGDRINYPVLRNDSDPDGTLMPNTVTLIGNLPSGAKSIINSDGTITFDYSAIPYFYGKETIIYRVCDNNGACDTAMVYITIDVKEIRIPTGFSPNNDNKNDFFVIPGIEKYPDCELIVFNRWGNEIYRKKPYLNDWDGRAISKMVVGNTVLPEGTYYYILHLGKDNKTMAGYIYLKK
jgi:gliding motility-associated-like protein